MDHGQSTSALEFAHWYKVPSRKETTLSRASEMTQQVKAPRAAKPDDISLIS